MCNMRCFLASIAESRIACHPEPAKDLLELAPFSGDPSQAQADSFLQTAKV